MSVEDAPRSARILQIQTQAEAGGAQRISSMVNQGLRSYGHDIRTVFMYRKTAAYDDDPHAVFISSARPHGFFERLRLALRLIRYVRSEKPDVVITYQHYGNIVGALAGRLASARVVVANQSGNPSKRGVMLFAAWADHLYGILGLYDFIVVNSASTESVFRNRSPKYSARLVRIDHGVQPAVEMTTSRDARTKFDLPIGVSLIVTTGRLAPGKNQDVLVKALQKLPDAHLALAGTGPDRAELEQLAARLGFGRRVHFVGELAVDDVSVFLRAGDLFAFASSDETFGISVVEAALAGLPVVTSDLPVLREVLTNSEGQPAAIFFPPGDHDALAEAAARLFNDPKLADELRQAGQSLIGRYDPRRMVAAYHELLSGPLGTARLPGFGR